MVRRTGSVSTAREARPDPRSAWQPDGVHGLSRLVDHTEFSWQADGWRGRELLGRLVYELHIGTFTAAATFEAAIERLDHLVDLGVDFVEILPVAAFPGRNGWGYDGVFPYAVQESYGGPDGLKQFVDACHNRGLGVILDVVYNHLGPDGNVLPAFGPYFTDFFSTPWGEALNYCGAGIGRGASLHHRQRTDVAARLPDRRPAPRCRAGDPRHVGHARPGRTRGRSGRAV